MDAKPDAESCLNALSRMAHALGESHREEDVIGVLLGGLVDVLRARGAVLRLLGPDGNELLLAGQVGLSDRYVGRGPVRVGQSGPDWRVMNGQEVVIPDVTADSDFQYRRAAEEEGLRGMVGVPFHLRGRVLGVLRVYTADPPALAPKDMLLLRATVDLGALALEKVRLHQSLYHVAEALNSSLELVPMLTRVLEATVRWMSLKGAVIRLADEKGLLRLVASCGLSREYLDKGQVSLDKSQADQRALAGETVVLDDVGIEAGMQYPAEVVREGIRSVLLVPVRIRAEVRGVLRAYSAWPRRFGPTAAGFLTSVADLAALAIQNARLFASLKERCDDLETDLADWRRFLALG